MVAGSGVFSVKNPRIQILISSTASSLRRSFETCHHLLHRAPQVLPMIHILCGERDSILADLPSLATANQVKGIVAEAGMAVGVLYEMAGLHVNLADGLVAVVIDQEIGQRVLGGGV